MPYLTDEIRLAQTSKYGLGEEYRIARHHGLSLSWTPLKSGSSLTTSSTVNAMAIF